MNPLIKRELERVTSTDLKFDDSTTHIFIPKVTDLKSCLEVGSVYEIELSDSLLNPVSSSNLTSNWNAGRVPKHNRYISEIISKMPKMIKVNGVACDDQTDNFFGWLPEDSIKIINKIGG